MNDDGTVAQWSQQNNDGNVDGGWGVHSWYCGPDCPMETKAWKTDDTLKVTPQKLDQKEIMTAVKLYGIMASSLLLIALMVKLLGISLVLKYEI